MSEPPWLGVKGHAWFHLVGAVDDHTLAVLQSIHDLPLVAAHFAGLDRAHLNRVLLIQHKDGATAGLGHGNRALRNIDGASLLGQLDPNAYEQSGQEHAVRVGELAAQGDLAGFFIHGHVRKEQAALFSVVHVFHVHRNFGLLACALVCIHGRPHLKILGHRLVDVGIDGVELLYLGQCGGLVFAHQSAFCNVGGSDFSGDGSFYSGIAQIQGRGSDSSLGGFLFRLGNLVVGGGGVVVLLAYDFGF